MSAEATVEAAQADGTAQDVSEAGAVDVALESSAEAQVDAPADSPGDAGGADACDAAVEDCTNGLDDNCNGLVDCADPECASQGFACTPAVPVGWSLVAYVENARPSCPVGWGASAPNVEGPDGGGACQCACGAPTVNPCVQGTLSMSLGQNVCGCQQVQDVPLVSNGLRIRLAPPSARRAGPGVTARSRPSLRLPSRAARPARCPPSTTRRRERRALRRRAREADAAPAAVACRGRRPQQLRASSSPVPRARALRASPSCTSSIRPAASSTSAGARAAAAHPRQRRATAPG